jgi:uncharacterized protein with ACT and thioredoxin-like domain
MAFEYHFKNITGLVCDSSGNFSYNNTPIKKCWRPGQVFLNIKKKRIGIKKLRKLAFKTESIHVPF